MTAHTTPIGETSCCAWRGPGSSFTARDAVARALRETTASLPFSGIETLEQLGVPVLVVASHDDADPGHPWDVAVEWTERIPGARMVSEADGESPLAWQGGKLSREIADFCSEDAVAERL